MRTGQVNLKLNARKSLICQISVKYVGYVLTHNDIMPDHERVHLLIRPEYNDF